MFKKWKGNESIYLMNVYLQNIRYYFQSQDVVVRNREMVFVFIEFSLVGFIIYREVRCLLFDVDYIRG